MRVTPFFKKHSAIVFLGSTLLFLTSGCEKINLGAIMGAAGGTAIGSQIGDGTGKIIAVAVGTLAGAWIGSEIYTNLNYADRKKSQEATRAALENNKTITWKNERSGNSGETKTSRTFTQDGKRCSEFTQVIVLGGEKNEVKGTACFEKDGRWRIAHTKND